ncbi:granzyme A-like [Polypterus senegalus]
MTLTSAYALCLFTVTFLGLPGDDCMEIIGGKEVARYSRPYMALVQNQNSSVCGGTLIKPNWVLTAAHCISQKLKVTLGAHSISKSEKEKQIFVVKKAIMHQCFDNETRTNDLMLLQLDKPAKLNRFVSTLKLPSVSSFKDIKANTLCSTAGWGRISNKKNSDSDVLMEVNITVIERAKCQKTFIKENQVITRNMLCAGDKRGKKDTCEGDSGGPLICNNEFAAITSFGSRKCASKPGVYTLLTPKYIQWIHNITGGEFKGINAL